VIEFLKKLVFSADKKPVVPAVFFPADQQYSAEDIGAQKKYIQDYKLKIERILKGEQLAWLDSFYMCAPRFPEVQALEVTASYEADWSLARDDLIQAARVDMFVARNKPFTARFELGGVTFSLMHEKGNLKLRIEEGGKEFSLKTNKGYFSLSVYASASCQVLWLSGVQRRALLQGWDGDWRFDRLDISMSAGSLAVVGEQKWTSTAAQYKFPEINAGDGAVLLKSSPYWVREWEERARKLWHMSIALRVSVDALAATGLRSGDALPAHILELSQLIVSAIHQFSHWRPAAGLAADQGDWERGNWASGFIPGAFGLCVALLKDYDALHLPEANLVQSGADKGLIWLLRASKDTFTTQEFPSPAHWLRRSTNHGIVVLASALVGLEELSRSLNVSELTDDLACVREDFWQLLNSSFLDGLYLEGVRYAQFSLQEAIAYIVYSYAKSGVAWEDYYKGQFPELARVKAGLDAAIYPGSDVPMVNWGDCPILPWKHSVLNFLDAIEGGASLTAQIENLGHRAVLQGEVDDEILKTEPLTLPTRLLPRAKLECTKGAQRVSSFGAGIGAVQAPTAAAYNDWRLYVVATQVHLTHNRDHDCGSFFWAADGKLLVGEAAGRAAYNHSSIALYDSLLHHPEDPYSCYGGEKDGSLIDRAHGATLAVKALRPNLSVVTVEAEAGLLYQNGKPLVKGFRRDFVVLGDNSPELFVITRASAVSGRPYLNFILPSTDSLVVRQEAVGVSYPLAETRGIIQFINIGGFEFSCASVSMSSGEGASRVVQQFAESDDGLLSVVAMSVGAAKIESLSEPAAIVCLKITLPDNTVFKLSCSSLTDDICVEVQ
jgi:hypothetical protein